MSNRLEPSEAEWDDWTRQVLDFMKSPKTEQGLPCEIPEAPLSGGLARILPILGHGFEQAVPTDQPGFMAYVPGGGIPSAALANFLGNLANRFTGIEEQAPFLVSLEKQVITWLCREVGLPSTAFGILTSGGSMANLTAVICARVHVLGDTGDFSKARLYVSDQVHHSVQKAAFLAGIPKSNCVSIQTDAQFCLSLEHLEEQIRQDRRMGLKPFLLVGSAGTTSTGSIDNLEALASLSKQENLWFHVDAAYGGAFVLCPAGKAHLKGIEWADSVTFDPHKGLFLPYGTGCLLVKDKASLLKVHRYEAAYLSPSDSDSPASLGPELCREYRGIRLWLPLMLHGAGAFRRELAEKLELTNWLYQALLKLRIEVLLEPMLSVLVFKPDITERVNSYGRVYLAPTQLRGVSCTRICILSFRTHQEQVQACLEDIQKAFLIDKGTQ